MKAPTKQQLYEQISELERINRQAYEERTKARAEYWQKLLPLAYEECRKQLTAIFPNLLTLLHYEHVDEGGYWFTFQLVNDSTVQTYAVRHADINLM